MTSMKNSIAPKQTKETQNTGKSGLVNTAYRDQALGGMPEKRNKDQIFAENSPKTNPKAIR
jgi:hypothetical protein